MRRLATITAVDFFFCTVGLQCKIEKGIFLVNPFLFYLFTDQQNIRTSDLVFQGYSF
jgi:hypothetical protein